jgi:hypothetical protein
MRKHTATFANFILRFGGKTLVDYLNEIVVPAFTDRSLVRSYGDRTSYQFYQVSVENLGSDTDPIGGIVGRFVKDTTLTRTQILDPKAGLKRDEQSMRSAPSAFFVLILNNHRLIYFPETAHAPDLSAFRSTAKAFIGLKREQFIQRQYDEAYENDAPVTKRQLGQIHPPHTLEIVPLTSSESIEDFVAGYEKLKSVQFKLLRPNDDIDAQEMFRDFRAFMEDLDPKTTRISVSNPEGLDKQHAVEAIHAASASGNQEVTLSGTDNHGNQIRGNNDRFKIGVEVSAPPRAKRRLAGTLYELFEELQDEGTIRIDSPSAGARRRVERAIRALLGIDQ